MLQNLNTLDVTLLFIILTIMVVAIGVVISTLLKNSKVVPIIEEVKTIQQQQLEFLQDMLDYYSVNPNERRNITISGKCRYAPIKYTSKGCAIGRKIPLELAEELDRSPFKSISNINVFKQMPIELKMLGNEFLRDIQYLHDNNANWETTGLSVEGLERVQKIRLQIKTDYYVNN